MDTNTETQTVSPASRFNNLSPWLTALIVFLVCLSVFLSVRASDEYRWSDWGFGDAQTMLSLRQWEEGGWFANYLLFIPQGYAKGMTIFDDPELRQHAHGTCPGSSPQVGPRLRYTHYPAGYLLPYAVLFRAGLDSLFAVRMLSLVFSIGALVLMYMVFSKITTPGIAFLSVFFYGLTPAFLGYADALANQPLDDLLRFGFMLAVVMSTRAGSEGHRHRWLISAWLAEFLLSLSSFDSVFFIYVWLIGWDLLDGQGFRLKRYLLFSLAPLSAHGLQFMQNVWYLGFSDALIDIRDAFLQKNAAVASYNLGQGRLTVIRDTVYLLFNNLYFPAVLLLFLLAFYSLYSLLLKEPADKTMPSIFLVYLLFLCGLAFVILLPHAARMPYEARQMVPFISLLAGGVTYSFGREFGVALYGPPEAAAPAVGPGTGRFRAVVRPVYLFFVFIFLIFFWHRFMLNDRTPVYFIPDAKTDARYAQEIEKQQAHELQRFRTLRADVLVAEGLRKIKTAYDPVIFSMNGFKLFWDPKYVPGYPQIMPITEYYTGSRPVLCFDAPEGVVKDLMTMISKSPQRFSPLLISRDAGALREMAEVLHRRGALSGIPPVTDKLTDMAVLDLTGHIRWPR
ncbi:MAG: hypothetical protein ACYC69_17125 [Thermodesulfovibrionales bacterium]